MRRMSDLVINKFYFELVTSHLPKQSREEKKRCDGCGSPEIYREINPPFLEVKVFICKKCWDEFMLNS